MYGCKDSRAWMAHGFTDDTLDGFPYGDNQWALCVTCGAWAALTIWEHLIAQPLSVAVLMEVVRSLRGVALFFQEYTWNDTEGKVHTGPTTSPENSYVMLFDAGNCYSPVVLWGGRFSDIVLLYCRMYRTVRTPRARE
jgi:alpha-L-fucosidase 2